MYKDKKISFVILCYKSAKTIGFIVEKIYESFPVSEYITEIVLVNDGSGDDTFQAIKNWLKSMRKLSLCLGAYA